MATQTPAPLSAADIAAQLGEPALPLIAACVMTFGGAACAAYLAETLAVEAQGGLLRLDGQRRTPGGTFFAIAKRHCSLAEWRRLSPWRPLRLPRVDRRPPVCEVPLQALWSGWPTDLRQGGGKVKVVLTGRPKETVEQEGYVLLQMASTAPQNYPRGLPVPPAQGLVWTVLIARPQWQAVAPALRRDPEDILIIEGQPCQVEAALVLYATQVITRGQQKAKSAQQKAQAARTPQRGTHA